MNQEKDETVSMEDEVRINVVILSIQKQTQETKFFDFIF
jgi:hypothetical protein